MTPSFPSTSYRIDIVAIVTLNQPEFQLAWKFCRHRIYSTGVLMNDSFLWYMFKRFMAIFAIVVGFCMLPGPRRILGNALNHILAADSQNSLWTGFHLSMIHFCWLLDFEMQLLPYPKSVDPLLANTALLFGIVLQVTVAIGIWMLSNFAFLYYDPERPTEELLDVDEELSVAPVEESPASNREADRTETPRVHVG